MTVLTYSKLVRSIVRHLAATKISAVFSSPRKSVAPYWTILRRCCNDKEEQSGRSIEGLEQQVIESRILLRKGLNTNSGSLKQLK